MLKTILYLLLLSGSAAWAQKEPTKPQTVANVEAQYKSCTKGYYTGPRPSRVRYTQDNWVWAVTPEFAKNYCFPEHFIVTDLKGAEAVALRMHTNLDEIVCGWGDNKEVCRPTDRKWRFEFYVPHGQLPKEKDNPFFSTGNSGSSFMITRQPQEFDKVIQNNRAKPKPGAIGIFSSISLFGVKNGEAKVAIGSMGNTYFYENYAMGLDLLRLEMSPGTLSPEFEKKRDFTHHVIAFKDPKNDKPFSNEYFSQAPYKIELPRKLIESMWQQEQQDLKQLAQDIKRIQSPANPAK